MSNKEILASQADSARREDIDDDFDDADLEAPPQASDNVQNEGSKPEETKGAFTEFPSLNRKDKSLEEMLELMSGEFSPIIPDAVTDYYLARNGFDTVDIRVKRLLALATQKYISDIAQDAYEYSRIRSSSAVYNSSNPQVRAKQLLQGQQFANQQNSGTGGNVDNMPEQSQPSQHFNAGHQQGKIVLTMEDLSNALSEYGVNASKPAFYR